MNPKFPRVVMFPHSRKSSTTAWAVEANGMKEACDNGDDEMKYREEVFGWDRHVASIVHGGENARIVRRRA
jgi:hypothetical protein